MASPVFPAPPSSVPPTPTAELDRKLDRLRAAKDAWVQLPRKEKVALLREVMQRLQGEGPAWAGTLARIKGFDPESPASGEAWLDGPVIVARNLRQYIELLEHDGHPKPAGLRQRADGQWVAQVFPRNLFDKLLLDQWVAEVWIEKGKAPSQGAMVNAKPAKGRVGLVLGAGNMGFLAPCDALYKLIFEHEVVIMKMNPVLEAGGPHLEKIFAPFIERGFLEVCYGAGDVGAYLTAHADVESLHITGSNRTYDAIVWGAAPDEQAQRKKSGEKKIDKPFSAELGGVGPVLVVPGAWRDKDLRYQASHVLATMANNASFACVAGKVLVLAKDWPQKDRFLELLREEMARTAPRKAYYPGAAERHRAFVERYPKAEVLGEAPEGALPWTLVANVPAQKDEYALTHEAFCTVIAQVELPGQSGEDFLPGAVDFANDVVWGTLGAQVIVDPETQTRMGARFENELARLRYGVIGVNVWSGAGGGLTEVAWGAYPGHSPEDIQSGMGKVHNGFGFDFPEKSVIRGPFRPRMKHVYFHGYRTLNQVGATMLKAEQDPSLLRIPKLAAAALRG
ncbi:MAG: aldehyde dehydrogenase [Deltaproteobacteria bacterium]|nr:aldehyde dehydrogenase [Deltaproteobacteria bacterium]